MNNLERKQSEDRPKGVLIQFIRYTFVGGAAFLVDIGLLYVLKEFIGLPVLWAATISFIAGLLVNYFISTIWVFGASSYNKKVEFLLFALIGIVGLGLNDFFIWIFTPYFYKMFSGYEFPYNLLSKLQPDVIDKAKAGELPFYLLAKLIAVILVYLWNFFGRRYLVFNKQKT